MRRLLYYTHITTLYTGTWHGICFWIVLGLRTKRSEEKPKQKQNARVAALAKGLFDLFEVLPLYAIHGCSAACVAPMLLAISFVLLYSLLISLKPKLLEALWCKFAKAPSVVHRLSDLRCRHSFHAFNTTQATKGLGTRCKTCHPNHLKDFESDLGNCVQLHASALFNYYNFWSTAFQQRLWLTLGVDVGSRQLISRLASQSTGETYWPPMKRMEMAKGMAV